MSPDSSVGSLPRVRKATTYPATHTPVTKTASAMRKRCTSPDQRNDAARAEQRRPPRRTQAHRCRRDDREGKHRRLEYGRQLAHGPRRPGPYHRATHPARATETAPRRRPAGRPRSRPPPGARPAPAPPPAPARPRPRADRRARSRPMPRKGCRDPGVQARARHGGAAATGRNRWRLGPEVPPRPRRQATGRAPDGPRAAPPAGRERGSRWRRAMTMARLEGTRPV